MEQINSHLNFQLHLTAPKLPIYKINSQYLTEPSILYSREMHKKKLGLREKKKCNSIFHQHTCPVKLHEDYQLFQHFFTSFRSSELIRSFLSWKLWNCFLCNKKYCLITNTYTFIHTRQIDIQPSTGILPSINHVPVPYT